MDDRAVSPDGIIGIYIAIFLKAPVFVVSP